MKITAEMLRGKKACEPQVKTFKQEWPAGAEVTIENIMRAQELELDIDYAAQRLFAPPAWEKYKKALAAEWAKYLTARVVALAKFQTATFAEWTKFQTATFAEWAKFQTATFPAWKEFETAKAVAWKEFETAKAVAFLAASKIQ